MNSVWRHVFGVPCLLDFGICGGSLELMVFPRAAIADGDGHRFKLVLSGAGWCRGLMHSVTVIAEAAQDWCGFLSSGLMEWRG